MEWKIATLTAALGVVALTIWAAVAPDVLQRPWGLLVGAALIGVASVAAGYVPLVRGAVQRRGAELERLEAEEVADQEALRRAGELPGESPAGLLDPRRGLVGFTGREQELVALLAWCRDDPVLRGVRLVTGPGGVGKTRLSVELCARLDPGLWRCMRVGDGEEASALATARRGWPGRVLLVVDYAETRIGLPDLLRAVAADPGPVRVLLLARSAGEWRDRLAAAEPAVRELLAGAGGEEPLPVAVSGKLSNTELVEAAVPVFAKELEVAVPSRVALEAGSGPVRVLDLHAAALVAVLRSAGAGSPVQVRIADVMDDLLRHEERFWQRTAERLGLLAGAAGMTVGALRQIVAAGALLGAASQDQAVELLGRVPGAVASVKVACWLRDLYPPEAGSPDGAGAEWLGALHPDRLAEHLVIAQLTASAELAERCLRRLDERQALRAVTLLGHAAADQQDAEVLLKRLMPLLDRAVTGLPPDVGLLTAISGAIPYPSTALAETHLAITRRVLELLPGGDPGLRAAWLGLLSLTLSQTGGLGEALRVSQEEVTIRRELAAADPEHYRASLAAALSNLANRFFQLGRPHEALPADQEAVEIYRELAADSEHYQADLAAALSNLGVRFGDLGQLRDALQAELEAVEIRRELTAADPGRYQADLALSLANLGVRFSALGQRREALQAAQEAVEIRQALAAADPDRYKTSLAESLSNLGASFSELGRPGEALPADQEALKIWRELAAAYPGRYQAELALAVSNLGVRLAELGRLDDAVPVMRDAVKMRRELAAAYPDRYRASLADSLSNLGGSLTQLGRPSEAMLADEEAVRIRQELAAADPDRYQASLADSLTNLGTSFAALGHRADALSVGQEAVTTWRELAAAYPARYQADLALSLSNLAARLGELGRLDDALPVIQEAVEIRRELAVAYPDRYRDRLAHSLRILAQVHDGLGHKAEAEVAHRDAEACDLSG